MRGCQVLVSQSGSGKSKLLEWGEYEIPETLQSVKIQLRGSETSFSHLFLRLGQRAGWGKLPLFANEIARLSDKPPMLKNECWALDVRHYLQTIFQNVDQDRKKARYNFLTDAWFEDVRQFEAPFVLFTDTFENATEEFKQWLSAHFLQKVYDEHKMRVVVAGQKVPDKSGDWSSCCNKMIIEGVLDANAWMPVVKAMHRALPSSDFLVGVCTALKGKPGAILEIIQALPEDQDKQSLPIGKSMTLPELRAQIETHFSIGEIDLLCFDLDIDPENIAPNEEKNVRTIRLLQHVNNLGRLDALLAVCRKLRSHLEWHYGG